MDKFRAGMEGQVDYPADDFASPGGTGDGETGYHGAGALPIDLEAAAIKHLTGIFGEAARIAAKSRILFHGVREGTGLTGSETQTLVAIAHAADPISVPQIGRFLGTPRQVVQRAIKVLERNGLVAPLPHQDYKRAPLFEATRKGRAAIDTIDAAARETMALMIGRLPAETLAPIHAGLVTVREQIDRMIGVQDD